MAPSYPRAPFFRCLHPLTADDPGARFAVAPRLFTDPFAQGIVDPLPGTIATPEPDIVVDGLPGWDVVRELAPGTASTNGIADGIQNLTSVASRTTTSLGCRGQGRENVPLGVRQIRGAGMARSGHRGGFLTLVPSFSDTL